MGTLAHTFTVPPFPARTWAHGDSLTAGQGGLPGWPAYIPRVYNLAVGGYETWQVQRDLYKNPSSRLQLDRMRNPEEMVLLVGINDLAQSHNSSFQGWHTELTTELTGRGIAYWLVTMLPLPEANSGVWSLNTNRLTQNQWLRDTYGLAGSGGRVIDVETAMGNGASPNRMPAALCYGDQVHLSRLGNFTLAGLIEPHLLDA
jgi:hypothetical protein